MLRSSAAIALARAWSTPCLIAGSRRYLLPLRAGMSGSRWTAPESGSNPRGRGAYTPVA